jgi:uncharacterized membrane protein YgcG/predicted metal-dependent hydrolase
MYRNNTVSWLIGLLILWLCLIPAAALAADIPEKDGYIQDTAQILTTSEFEALQQAINEATFSLYVYTVDSLGGSSISSVAASVFSEWSLGNQDALLIIAMEEHEVHLELLTGSALDKSITQAPEFRSSANKYTQLIDNYFVPYAADGDFQQGIMSVIRQLDVLQEQAGSPITNPSPSTDKAKASGVSSTIVFVVILLIIIAAVASFQWYRRFSIVKGKQMLNKELEAALGKINQIEQDIEPMVQLSKGESEAYLRSIGERFYELLQASTEFSNQLEAFVVPLWVTNSAAKGLQSLQQLTQTYTASSTEILNSLKQYQEMESNTTKVLEQSHSSWNQADQQLREHIEALGLPLEELLVRSASIQGILARSSDSIEFDPMHVKVLLEHVPEQIAQLINDIELVSNQKSALKQLPEQLQSTKKKLDQLINEEKLTMVEIKPYAFFDQVDSQMKDLSQCIQAGNTSGAAVILQRIEGWMEEAVEQVAGSVRARDWNKSAIEIVSDRLSRYDEAFIHQLEQVLQEIKQFYHPEHWGQIPEQIEQIRSKRSLIAQLLSETASYNDLGVQRYYEAERNLKQMIEQLVEMDASFQHISNLRSELDQAHQQQVEAMRLVEQRYLACKSSMVQSGIQSDARFQGLVDAAEQSIATMNRLIDDIPRNVPKITADIQTEAAVIQQLEEAVYAAIEAKRAADIALEQQRARRRRMNNNTFGGGGGGGGGFGGFGGGGGSGSSGGGSSWKSGGSRGGGSSFSSKSKGGGSSWGSGKSRGGGSKW